MVTALESKISDLSRLIYDWDGMGAMPANKDSMRHAKKFAAAFPELPLAPTLHANGNVVLFRRAPWVELEFNEFGEIGFHAKPPAT